MASWYEFVTAEPELAARVRAVFAVRKHCTMATLRADGAPRISGTEVEFTDKDVFLGMMGASMKARDVAADPRVAVHSPTVDPTADPTGGDRWDGEAKFSGLAHEVPTSPDFPDGGRRFRIDLTSVVFTGLSDDRQSLRIQFWRPEQGLQIMSAT